MTYRKTTMNARAPGQLTQGTARAARRDRDTHRSDRVIATRSGDDEPVDPRPSGPKLAPITAIQARERYAATVEVAPPQDPGGGEGPWTSTPPANCKVTSEIRNPKNGVCSTMDRVSDALLSSPPFLWIHLLLQCALIRT